MIDDVALLIKSMAGYDVPGEDADILQFLWTSTEREILNMTHRCSLPVELDPLHVRMTAGYYISTHLPQMAGADGVQVVKSIQEGNVRVDIGGESTIDRLKALADVLMKDGAGEAVCFRKLRWSGRE